MHDFKCLRAFMRRYCPLPTWLTWASYHLPVSPKNEFYNANFFYLFEAEG